MKKATERNKATGWETNSDTGRANSEEQVEAINKNSRQKRREVRVKIERKSKKAGS